MSKINKWFDRHELLVFVIVTIVVLAMVFTMGYSIGEMNGYKSGLHHAEHFIPQFIAIDNGSSVAIDIPVTADDFIGGK